jgi:transcriptional regulator with GAF, ATPase, and Fis domain
MDHQITRESITIPRDIPDVPRSAALAPFLTAVWREVGRHHRLEESVARLAPLLARRLPADEILVRQVEPAREALDTVALGMDGPGPAPERARTPCGRDDLERILAWCREGAVLRGSDRLFRKRLPGLVPPGVVGQMIAGPLVSADGHAAVLLLVARPPLELTEEHEPVAAALLEPLTVALENDHRLRELGAYREAAEAENRSLLQKLGRHDIADSVVGAETGLRPVMDQIALVAASDAPVLILGETGTGKEVVAREIHGRSGRHGGPFLRVNCGAIPSELVDSELFGHEKGSFTGAVGERKGWFERADGGTLFLDECGELPPAAQVRLLRILQDGQFERVGGELPRHVDVRIVAATHRDLEAMVASGRFRQDLWYRLAVFPIRLPPLRARRADIPALASHFALRAARRLGFAARTPGPDDIARLVAYDWPGNVRELAAVIERAAILGAGERLAVAEALGAAPAIARTADEPDAPASPEPLAAPRSRVDRASFPTLDQAQARHIEAALALCRGRIEGSRGAAALLKINPHTLRARMRKLKIDWSKYRVDDLD